MKVLISDDSQFMRGILTDIVQSLGYEVLVAENGEETLQQYEKEKPDLLLLDIIMPQVDGIDVLKKVGRKAKVIVVSAVGQEKMVAEAMELGAKDYIVKPFENKKVIEVIKKVMG